MNFTLVAAAKFEVEALKNALEQIGESPIIQIVGVGSLTSAKNARAVGDACRGANVLFVGTCGTFSEFSKPSLVTGKDIIWLPTSDRLGLSYTVKDSAPPLTIIKSLPLVNSLPSKKIICGPSISKTAKLPDELDPTGCVENLELYSCASEIAAKAASFTIILCITNAVGPDSHTQWKEHFIGAATETADFVKKSIITKSGT